jgi:hypothetical protein
VGLTLPDGGRHCTGCSPTRSRPRSIRRSKRRGRGVDDGTAGDRVVGRVDWDVLAAAINDGCADQGVAPPMLYWAQLPAGDR